MNKLLTYLIGFSVVLTTGFTETLRGQEGQAGAPGAYLFNGVGARALGMGGAYTALSNDATAIYWNPAGLATQNPFQLSFMHGMLFMDTAMDFLAASAPTKQFGSFGIALFALTSGEFEQRDGLNNPVGSFDSRDLAFITSWSKEIMRNFSVGINYKFVSQKILSYSGSGHGIDFGIKKRFFDRIDGGLMVVNLLKPNVTLVQQADSYPMQVRAGVASAFINDNLVLSADMSKLAGWGGLGIHFGAEYNVMNKFALRMGMNEDNITFGAGFSFDKLGVGYSNGATSDLGSSHRFSLDYTFGGFSVDADATPRIFSPSGELNITRIKLAVKSRTEIKDWHFVIVDQTGQVIREFSTAGKPPTEVVWDGRNGEGTLVADGRYEYRFEVQTADDRHLKASGALVTIDTAGPQGIVEGAEE
ncbi:MAG TPA: PorV/PorQ family protein [bacterium]